MGQIIMAEEIEVGTRIIPGAGEMMIGIPGGMIEIDMVCLLHLEVDFKLRGYWIY